MFKSLALSALLLASPLQSADASNNYVGIAPQQILLDTGSGGGDGLPPISTVCFFSPSGVLSCFLRWGV